MLRLLSSVAQRTTCGPVARIDHPLHLHVRARLTPGLHMMTCLVDSRADPLSQNQGGAIAALTDDHINNARRRGWNRILALRRNSSRCLHEFHIRRHSPVCPEEALHEALLTSVATIAATATHEPQCVRRDRRPILVCVVAVSTEVDDAVLRVV